MFLAYQGEDATPPNLSHAKVARFRKLADPDKTSTPVIRKPP